MNRNSTACKSLKTLCIFMQTSKPKDKKPFYFSQRNTSHTAPVYLCIVIHIFPLNSGPIPCPHTETLLFLYLSSSGCLVIDGPLLPPSGNMPNCIHNSLFSDFFLRPEKKGEKSSVQCSAIFCGGGNLNFPDRDD